MNELFLALITSVDIFGAVMGLCSSRIKLPAASAVTVAAVGTAVLCLSAGLSELAAEIFGQLIPVWAAQCISKVVLALIGLKVLTEGVREAGKGSGKRLLAGDGEVTGNIAGEASDEISEGDDPGSEHCCSPGRLPDILGMTGAPEKADCDHSRSISPGEAALLGLALSADSVFTGIGAGLGGLSPVILCPLSLISGLAACGLGIFLGRLLCRRGGGRFPAGIVAGVGLIIAAVIF